MEPDCRPAPEWGGCAGHGEARSRPRLRESVRRQQELWVSVAIVKGAATRVFCGKLTQRDESAAHASLDRTTIAVLFRSDRSDRLLGEEPLQQHITECVRQAVDRLVQRERGFAVLESRGRQRSIVRQLFDDAGSAPSPRPSSTVHATRGTKWSA